MASLQVKIICNMPLWAPLHVRIGHPLIYHIPVCKGSHLDRVNDLDHPYGGSMYGGYIFHITSSSAEATPMPYSFHASKRPPTSASLAGEWRKNAWLVRTSEHHVTIQSRAGCGWSLRMCTMEWSDRCNVVSGSSRIDTNIWPSPNTYYPIRLARSIQYPDDSITRAVTTWSIWWAIMSFWDSGAVTQHNQVAIHLQGN